MKDVKFRTGIRADLFPVERTVFESQTNLKHSFQQFSEDDNKHRQYTICPHCENPVQLIGLYSGKGKKTPYGKHAGKNVEGFPKYDINSYIYCPYASNKRHIHHGERLETLDEKTRELYTALRENYDRVIYVIKRVLGISLSYSLAEDALKSYRENQAYLYPWTSLANLPWMICYFGLNQRKLYAQKIKSASLLCQKIRDHCPGAVYESSQNDPSFGKLYFEDGCYHRLQMRFLGHNQTAESGTSLLETIKFYVDRFKDGSVYDHDEIFEQTIEIDQSFFYNLIYKDGNDKYRDQKLLDIAKKVLIPLD